jgi:(p)ppGpp synthase/HD superfamily hydrolase
MSAELAHLIADVAHRAIGQKRADRRTPYIRHPERVARLVETWLDAGMSSGLGQIDREVAVSAAYLHDVIEDTRVKPDDLLRWGVPQRVVDVVDLLSKKNSSSEPETEAYYRAVAGDDTALFVKAADRSSNLEDALLEVRSEAPPRRWSRYADRTRAELLPLYAHAPELQTQLEKRLRALESALAQTAKISRPSAVREVEGVRPRRFERPT